MVKLRRESIEQMLFLLGRIKARHRAGDTVTEAQKMATVETSKNYDVEGPTISDLQTRRLDIQGIINWRKYLEDWLERDSDSLINVILQHAKTQDHNTIREFFENGGIQMPHDDSTKSVEIDENYNFNTSQDTAKKIKVMALMSGDNESQWLEKNIPEMVNNKYIQWLESQKK